MIAKAVEAKSAEERASVLEDWLGPSFVDSGELLKLWKREFTQAGHP